MGQTLSTCNDGLFDTRLGDSQSCNSQLNHREYLEQKSVLRSWPRRLVFELTNRCNFRCIMCGREAADFQEFDMPVAALRRLEPCFRQAEEVTLHGWGEGTLHPRFAEILAYLDNFRPLRKYFVTNGSTLDRIREPVFRHRVDLIALSLDGASAAVNDGIRVNGSFERQIGSLQTLLAEKRDRGLDYPYVNFVFTAMRRNLHELPALVDLAHRLGVPEVKVVYLTIFSPDLLPESLLDRQEEVRMVFAEAITRAVRQNIKLKLPEIQGEGKDGEASHRPCPFPWRDLYVGSDGFLRPCQSSALRLANIYDFEDFGQLWNSPTMRAMRLQVNSEAGMPDGCRRCYHSSSANYNLAHSFIQYAEHFAPEWSRPDDPPEVCPLSAPGYAAASSPNLSTN